MCLLQRGYAPLFHAAMQQRFDVADYLLWERKHDINEIVVSPLTL